MTTINIAVFDPKFQNSPQFTSLLAIFNQSPLMVTMLNSLNDKSVKLGDGTGTSSTGSILSPSGNY